MFGRSRARSSLLLNIQETAEWKQTERNWIFHRGRYTKLMKFEYLIIGITKLLESCRYFEGIYIVVGIFQVHRPQDIHFIFAVKSSVYLIMAFMR